MSMVIELAPFKLAPDVTQEAIMQASDELQTQFLEKQEGYVRRDLVRDGDSWYDIIHWTNREAAERAMQQAMASDACLRYFKLMEGVTQQENPGADLQHLTVVRSYPD